MTNTTVLRESKNQQLVKIERRIPGIGTGTRYEWRKDGECMMSYSGVQEAELLKRFDKAVRDGQKGRPWDAWI